MSDRTAVLNRTDFSVSFDAPEQSPALDRLGRLESRPRLVNPNEAMKTDGGGGSRRRSLALLARDLAPLPFTMGAVALRSEWLTAVAMVAVLLATFKIRYYARELHLFLVGFGVGMVFEIGGDLIYKLQNWSAGSLFGIPVWLPILWGLGFVFIRRVGNRVAPPLVRC